MTGFRHNLMAHAAVGIKMETQIVFLRKFPHFLVIGRTFYIRTGCIMVKHKGTSLSVPHLFAAHFIERINGLQIEIVDFGKIHFSGHDLAGFYAGFAAVFRQDFFNGVHNTSPFVFSNYNIFTWVLQLHRHPTPDDCRHGLVRFSDQWPAEGSSRRPLTPKKKKGNKNDAFLRSRLPALFSLLSKAVPGTSAFHTFPVNFNFTKISKCGKNGHDN